MSSPTEQKVLSVIYQELFYKNRGLFLKLLALLHWFGASACRTGMRNTLLPCSVGRADGRITDAWIYSEAEKEAGQKASAMTKEMALAVGSRRLLISSLVLA